MSNECPLNSNDGLRAENERLRVVVDAALIVYRRHDDEIQSDEWDDLEAALIGILIKAAGGATGHSDCEDPLVGPEGEDDGR